MIEDYGLAIEGAKFVGSREGLRCITGKAVDLQTAQSPFAGVDESTRQILVCAEEEVSQDMNARRCVRHALDS